MPADGNSYRLKTGKMNMRYIKLASVFLAGVLLSACDKIDPKELRERQHLPEPGYVADIAKGNQSFHQLCAYCHGAAGRGTEQGPPLVDNIYNPYHHADMAFHWAVRDGVRQHHWHFGDMPPQTGVSPETVSNIIAYIRAEQLNAGIK